MGNVSIIGLSYGETGVYHKVLLHFFMYLIPL